MASTPAISDILKNHIRKRTEIFRMLVTLDSNQPILDDGRTQQKTPIQGKKNTPLNEIHHRALPHGVSFDFNVSYSSC
jgi:hypothetical protein